MKDTSRHIALLLTFVIVASVQLFGQSVVAEVDSAHLMIGDHLKYRFKIKKATDVENPSADLSALDTLKTFELVREFDWEKITNDNDVYFQKEITITSFDSGYYFFPSLKVAYEKGGKSYSQSTQQIQLAVITPQIDSLHIRPIKGIVEEPIKLEDFYTLFLTIGSILILGFLGFFFYKRYNKNKSEEEVYVAPPKAHEVAIEKLKVLKSKELWQKGKLKEYQSELTYIVREYLEARFEIQALETTTDEIVKELKQKDISDAHKAELADMFRMADMVKFAKATPPIDIQSTLLNKAEQFVQNTKQEIIDNPEISAE